MALLLIFTFLLVLFFSVLTHFLPTICRKAISYVSTDEGRLQILRAQLQDLVEQLHGVSMVDEFARYARTERQINKVKVDIKAITKARSMLMMKVKLGVRIVLYAFQALSFLSLIYIYRHIPVLQLKSDWFYPIDPLLSYPTGVPGAVSLLFWLFVCRTVVSKATAVCQNSSLPRLST